GGACRGATPGGCRPRCLICGAGVPGRPSSTVTRHPRPRFPAPGGAPVAVAVGRDNARLMADPRIRLSEPTVGEEEAGAAARAVRDGHLVFGPDLPAFEAALAGAVGAHDAVAPLHRSAALHLGPGRA